MLIKLIVIGLLSFYSFGLSANQKLVLWSAHEHAEYLDKAIAEFQLQTGIEVELHQFISSRLREELQSLARNDNLPELLYVPADFIGMYRNIHLSIVPKDWMLSVLSPAIRKMGQVNETSYGIPLFQGNHLMLFYNKTLVKNPAASWKELRQQAKDFTAPIEYPIAWKFSEMFWFMPFLTGFGGWPMDGNNVNLNTPEMVNALTFYRELYKDKLISIRCDQTCAVEKFITGKVPYIINGDWAIRELEADLGDKLGIATLPTINGKKMLPMSSAYVLAFPELDPNSKQFQLLKKFSLFMQSKEIQKIIQELGGLIPVNSDVIAKPEAKQSENQKAVMAQMLETRPMPNNPNMVVAWLAMSKGFNRFMGHNYSAEKTVEYMQKIADKEIIRRSTKTSK